ncbi:MAG: aromatic-ring-hydroxylating dioxygenase, beta subunit [Hydrogenibacillus schlegelii]|uniref:Aromatic-ring-hydroxylating dioxygenase, beta subunit n=1 Tax=Hydrogenibacillus schlegelii TaxID=1484 RepID=A0A2T5G3U3_HYDSH|nr:MAG: aromatic-ring-hydroxylating dioxygenase, beta subunit [Hydrogenibacillus schlegelii]
MTRRVETMEATKEGSLQREIEAFLYLEAELLDDQRFQEWLALLTDDVQYVMPVRITREKAQGKGIIKNMSHFVETKYTLRKRIERLDSEYAWAEDPPSRTRHFVSNIRIAPDRPDAGEVSVKSNVLVYRSRGDDPTYDILSAERHDVLRRTPEGWRLASRTIYLDHSVVTTRNLAIFF